MLRRLLLILCAWGCLSACEPSPEEPLPTLFITSVPATISINPPQALAFWQPTEGRLNPDALLEIWRFTAQVDDDITLRAIGQGITIQLALIDTSGTVLKQGGDTLQLILPATDDYEVQVTGDQAGAYTLGLSYTGQPNPSDVPPTAIPLVVGVPTPLPVAADLGEFMAVLNDGETASELLTNDLNQHVFTYNAAAGQYLNVEMTRVSGDLDPLLTLYDPDGEVLGLDANSGINDGALLRNIPLVQDGFYTIQVSGRGFSGVYALRLDVYDVPQPVTPTLIYAPSQVPIIPALTPTIEQATVGERLEDHIPVMGKLENSEDLQRHSFEAGVGELITLAVIPALDSALIPYVELYDPEGVPVAVVSGNASPTNRQAIIPLFVAAQAGPYTAFVTAEGETSGDYMIAYGTGSTYADVMRGEALADREIQATMDRPGVREIWYAYFQQGDVITVEAGGNNLVLELVADSGDLLGIDSQLPRSTLQGITIPRTGLYYIRISPINLNIIGDYTVIWRYINVAPTATPQPGISRVLSISDSVAENAYQFYPFYGRAGQRLRINVIALRETPLDPVVALLNPEAEVIATGDDSEGGLNPVVYTAIPVDGTYTVRVNGYLSSGKFELVVEELIVMD
ncbi:MAG: PPC domain-containing protein [Anaerolineae bacterium]|nr:PPC domain-containing protein [Anaerolineae bacterium]